MIDRAENSKDRTDYLNISRTHAQLIIQALGWLATLLLIRTLKGPTTPDIQTQAVPTESQHRLDEAATEYGNQAREYTRGVRNFYLATIVFLLLSGWVGVSWARRVHAPHSTVRASQTIPYIALGLISLGSAGFSSFQAGRLRRLCEESTRLQQQLRYLNAYLAPLPKPTQHLIRGAMTQRLFPRALADKDPLREPQWPTPVDLLASFSPEIQEVFASEENGAEDDFLTPQRPRGFLRRIFSGFPGGAP
jgi:hypothetical protein